MNLVWLKYVSYACVGGAVCAYVVLRMNRLTVGRNFLLGLYAACIALACLTWHVQESNADHHSPRSLVIGTVASVSVSAHKGGSIEDKFQLKTDTGLLSPEFSTDVVASSRAEQPIHEGDTLGVLYRTWDDVPVTIDELSGQRQGWHYHRYRALEPYVWAVGIAGMVGFVGAYASSRRRGTPATDPDTTL